MEISLIEKVGLKVLQEALVKINNTKNTTPELALDKNLDNENLDICFSVNQVDKIDEIKSDKNNTQLLEKTDSLMDGYQFFDRDNFDSAEEEISVSSDENGIDEEEYDEIDLDSLFGDEDWDDDTEGENESEEDDDWDFDESELDDIITPIEDEDTYEDTYEEDEDTYDEFDAIAFEEEELEEDTDEDSECTDEDSECTEEEYEDTYDEFGDVEFDEDDFDEDTDSNYGDVEYGNNNQILVENENTEEFNDTDFYKEDTAGKCEQLHDSKELNIDADSQIEDSLSSVKGSCKVGPIGHGSNNKEKESLNSNNSIGTISASKSEIDSSNGVKGSISYTNKDSKGSSNVSKDTLVGNVSVEDIDKVVSAKVKEILDGVKGSLVSGKSSRGIKLTKSEIAELIREETAKTLKEIYGSRKGSKKTANNSAKGSYENVKGSSPNHEKQCVEPVKKEDFVKGSSTGEKVKNVSVKGSSSIVKERDTSISKNKIPKEKPNYSEMDIAVLWKYVKKFMVAKGVKEKPVDSELLEAEFGANNVIKLLRKNYILRKGKGFTMGLY